MSGRVNQVLLVGEATARLEVDLVPYGLTCHTVSDAKTAVEELKTAMGAQQPWASVVVAAGLPDMSGPAFVDGLMKHFDPSTVVLLADLEPTVAQHLSQSPKISIFPDATDGVVVGDHLFKRMGGASGPPSPSLPPPPPSLGTPSSSMGLASLFDPPRTGVGAGTNGLQQTPNQAFSMPPPTNSFSQGAPSGNSWSPPPPATPPRPTTMPFFAALSQSQPPQAPVSSPPTNASSPPASSGAERATLARIEALAEELDNARAEIITLKARLQAAETRANTATEKAFHQQAAAEAAAAEAREAQVELEMVRHAVNSDVAEINPIADDGAMLQAELDNLRLELHGAMTDRDGAMGQLEMVRGERDQLTHTIEAMRGELVVMQRAVSEANADVEQQRTAAESIEAQLASAQAAVAELPALQALLAEKDVALDEARAVGAELLSMTAELGAMKAEFDALRIAKEESDAAWAAEQAKVAALEAQDTELSEASAELAALCTAKEESDNAWAAEQTKVAALEATVAELEVKAADSEAALANANFKILELDSKISALSACAEAAMAAELRVAELEAIAADIDDLREQLAEAERYSKLEEARADRAVSDAAGMRQMIEAQTHEQARIVGEIEQLRPIANEVERARAAMIDMQRQLEAALGTDEADGSTENAIEEGVRARTRELLELARAIEPFTWGLDQAAIFFADVDKEGAQRHVQAMRLLQKTLERLKNELDRLHG